MRHQLFVDNMCIYICLILAKAQLSHGVLLGTHKGLQPWMRCNKLAASVNKRTTKKMLNYYIYIYILYLCKSVQPCFSHRFFLFQSIR